MKRERKKRRGEEEGGDEEEREKRKGGEEEFSLSRRVWEREGEKKHGRLRRARLKSRGAARMVSRDGTEYGGSSGTPAVLVLVLVPGAVPFGSVWSRLVLFFRGGRVLPNVLLTLQSTIDWLRIHHSGRAFVLSDGYDGDSAREDACSVESPGSWPNSLAAMVLKAGSNNSNYLSVGQRSVQCMAALTGQLL